MKRILFVASLVILSGGLFALSVSANVIWAKFKGGIGSVPLRAGGLANDVLGVNPGGRPWVIKDIDAEIKENGDINVQGEGLLLGGGNNIGRTGGNSVVAQLFCGTAPFTSGPVLLEPNGDFRINGRLSPVPPLICDNPVLLIRSFDPTASPPTARIGNWFAAGIPDLD